MTTQETTTTPAPAAPKAPSSYSIRLVAGTSEMLLLAYKTSAGFTSSVTVYTSPAVKGQRRAGQRGATATHPTLAAAKAALEKLAVEAVKKGWQRPEKKSLGGFVRKADAFDAAHIPAPAKAAKK